MIRSTLMAVVLLSLLAGGAAAGTIAPDLSALLDTMADTDYVPAIVMVRDPVDLEALNRELDGMHADRAYRHQRVVLALRRRAEETQGDLLAFLGRESAAGRARSVRGLWISNIVIVEAQKEVLMRLADRSDVGEIYYDYRIEPIRPVSVGKADESLLASIEEGLQRINAPAAWNRGYTGAGRLVSHLDTGVDGNHPALSSRWRGTHAPSAECWYDPVTNTTFPWDSGVHGTHTMGTTCGYNVSTDDHIGVAYEAEWIAASVIDRVNIPTTMADALTAFQWTADPDGDPFTIDDVPDVSSNSWGISPIWHSSYLNGPCDQYFWNVLDGCEAAGVVVVYAAGNEGNDPPNSIRNPSNRAVDPYNSFCVGAIDGANYGNNPAAGFSSRGPVPSDCGSYTTKPEVAAPGVSVRSSWPGGGYGRLDGTSMAAPHVAGAVAILRQADPNATSEQIKFALMESAQDLGTAGEDNTYGWGLIDVDAALDIILTTGCLWEVSCTPNGAPIVIPAGGGSFTFDGTLTNNCGFNRTSDIWAMVQLPGGQPYGPVFLYQDVPFTPGRVLTATAINQDVPDRAPAGTYRYTIYAGDYPSAPQDSCFFSFEKSAVAGGTAAGTIPPTDAAGGDVAFRLLGWADNEFAAAVEGEDAAVTR
jgi:bacillopeptidase F